MKLELPKMKMPKRRSGSSAVKPPKFAGDLYSDLRDRRLLPLIAVLVVAIAATPFLLGGGGDKSTPRPPVAATSSVAPTRASFAVVPAPAVLRDYHKRLAHRQASDPFDNPNAPQAAAEEDGSKGGEGSSETSAEEAPADAGSTEAKTTTKVVVQDQVLGYTIDTRAGFVGYVKPKQGIEPATKLPSAKNPVVVFVGLNKAKTGALFLMSSNVTAYYGKGRCAVDKQACQLLELKPGKSATFAYGYGESRYKVYLHKIVPVISTRTAAATVTTGGGNSANGGAGAGN